MEIYRITLTRYAQTLKASGADGRWSREGIHVIYSAYSRSLACLENIIHRGSEGLKRDFCTMVIHVPDNVSIKSIKTKDLRNNWYQSTPYAREYCQMIGNDWVKSNDSCVLRVPSVIIKEEHNYVINTLHPDFSEIELVGIEPFFFDPRLSS